MHHTFSAHSQTKTPAEVKTPCVFQEIRFCFMKTESRFFVVADAQCCVIGRTIT